jgi:elongation factor Ts
MANFGPKDVKTLREMTSAGMMDCKKALTESDGDMDKAVEWLKEKGLGAAAKKAGKVASEGVIGLKMDDAKAVLIEVNSQTDFVAQNDKFKAMVGEVCEHAFSNDLADAEAINNSTINSAPFSDYIAGAIATIGENIVVRRSALINGGAQTVLNGYVHANGKIGVLLAAECDSDKVAEAMKSALKDIAMHAAAMKPSQLSYQEFTQEFVESETKGRIAKIEIDNEELRRLGKPEKNIPQYVSRLQLTDDVIAQAKADIEAELKAEGKPEKIWDKIVPGKLERFISDNTLLDQELALLDQKFVMDDKLTVAEYVDSVAQKAGGSAKITNFVRLEVGEGIEKAEEDFAAEVAAAMK